MTSTSLFLLENQFLAQAQLLNGSSSPPPQHPTNNHDSGARCVGPAAKSEPSLRCSTCLIGVNGVPEFESAELARGHFKSDWHRHNLRRKVKGRAPINETQFEKIVQDDDEISSISGSDSSQDERQSQLSTSTDVASGGPVALFTSQGKIFGVWKCSIVQDAKSAQVSDMPEALRAAARMNSWAVILSKGGHFAAAVFERIPPTKGKPPSVAKVHKTIHKYVVRAKAGGRQSTKDATGKFAQSAGARIRRHNEAALERDIQETLESWKAILMSADVIYYQVSVTDRKYIFGGKEPPFRLADQRLRKITFNTRRPTFSETTRVSAILTSVFDMRPVPLLEPITLVNCESDSIPTSAIGEIGDGIQPEEASDEDILVLEELRQETELHTASREGDSSMITTLLQSGCNPELRDEKNRTPYQVAANKATRNAFRRYMAQEPEKWDYKASGLPSALTEEMEELSQEKKVGKRARQRARKKEKAASAGEQSSAVSSEQVDQVDDEVERAIADAAKETARIKQAQAAKRKSSSKKVGGSSTQQNIQSQDKEAVARRRELLAAAAEARLNALKQTSNKNSLW